MHPMRENGKWVYHPTNTPGIRQFVKSSGVINYELVCLTPGCRFHTSPIPNYDAQWHIRTNKFTELPPRINTSTDTCSYTGCESTEIEWHHFAPRNTFGREADNYPVMPLCRAHHQGWHQTMDGYRWRGKSAAAEDPEEVALRLLQEELGARRY
jgi:hypothetical protein